MLKLINKLPFAHHTWFMYLRLLIRHFIDDACTQKAASLTYTTLLSLVPLVTVIIVLFSSVPALEEIRGQVQHILYQNLLPSSEAKISEHLNTFAQNSSNLGIMGVCAVFITTIMTLITIETAFNQIWRVQERSGGMASILRYWMMICLAPIVLGVAFGASSMIQGLSFMNQKIGGYGIDWAIWAQIASFLFTLAGFIGMYWFIPKVKVPIKNAVIAGAVTTVLFEALKRIFGVIMTNFTSYEAIYGAFAAIPVFLMWIYLSWNVILLGVEISYTLTIFDNKEVAIRHPLLSLLDMLNLTYKKYQKGKAVSEAQLRDVLGRKELPKWNIYINELVDNELITHTKDDNYILRTDLETVSLWQLYKQTPYPLPIKKELDQSEYAKHDVWFTELSQHLSRIETIAKRELDIPLAQLFKTTPVREKEPPARLTYETPNDNTDEVGFNTHAKRTIDEHGNSVIIPLGEASFAKSSFAKAVQLAKRGWHFYDKSKKS